MLNIGSFVLYAAEKTSGIKSTGQNLLEFFGIILIFIIVLVACWATTRFVASKQLAGKNTGNFEVVETYAIARDRFLQLVRIGTKYYAIAVGKDSISVICELSKDEINLEKKPNGTSVNGFSNVLASILKKNENKDLPVDNDKQ
ncbi:MAG: flagellar biosynthetic protein FliO [Lachnospiraceae bacterium]|nr:flagellar biosynthetic protein FliO [Lachnospiraceae bacterium]